MKLEMDQTLSESQINELLPFRFTTEKSPSPLSIPLDMLSNEQELHDYIKKLGMHIEAANDKVTASIFLKRYAFLAVNYLYAMTAWNCRLDISVKNVWLVTDDRDEIWLPRFYFSNLNVEKVKSDRAAWRENCVKILFADHLYPLVKKLANLTKISKLILWENIAVYIYWLYETVFNKKEVSENIVLQASQDFHYLVFEASGQLFGSFHDNPLKRYFNQHIYLEEHDKEVRPRTTCCFSYLTNAKKRCVTCPHTCAACPLVSELNRQEEKELESRFE